MPKCYGRLPRPAGTKTKLMASFMLAAAAALSIPTQILYYQNLAPNALQMYGNEKAGDCTFAAAGNLVICQSTNAGLPTVLDPAQVLQGYISATGYNPQTGANDTGCVETDVLGIWKTTGIAGNVASDWCEIDPKNYDHLKLGTWYFGGLYLGLNVTAQAEQQFDAGQPWQRGWFNRIVGAHAVPLLGFDDATQMFVVGTWAKPQFMTYDYWNWYGVTSYAVVNKSFLKSSGINPVGMDLDAMLAAEPQVAA
jgi:hypothetical protein